MKHNFYLFAGLVFSLFLIFFSLFLAATRVSWWGRAKEISSLAFENSYLFASPRETLADGESPIRVTVFLLDNQGLGIPGKKVSLSGGEKLKIVETQGLTDNFGRAIFDLTSSLPGDYTLSALVEGAFLPQTVSVSFR